MPRGLHHLKLKRDAKLNLWVYNSDMTYCTIHNTNQNYLGKKHQEKLFYIQVSVWLLDFHRNQTCIFTFLTVPPVPNMNTLQQVS